MTSIGVRRGRRAGLALGAMSLAGVAALAALVVDPIVAVAGMIAIIAVVAIVEDPRVGILAIAAFSILRLSDIASDFHGAPSTFTPLLGLIALAVIAQMMRTGERPAGGGAAALVVLGLTAVALMSLPGATDMSAGMRAATNLLKDGAVAIAVGVLLSSTALLRQLVWVLLGGGLLLSGLSLIQFVTGIGSAFGGLAQSEVQHVVGLTDDVRLSGPIGDPNFYAQWLVLLVPLAIDRFHDETHRFMRLMAAACGVAASAVIVITFSRGGLLALAVVLGIMALRYPPRASTVVVGVIITVVAVPFLPAGYIDRMAALADLGGIDIGTDPSLRAREAEVAVAIDMFLNDPLTGVGYGNYLTDYTDHVRHLGLEQSNKPREAHNLYLEVAAETGLPGLAAFGAAVVFIGASLLRGRRAFRMSGDHSSDGIGYAVGASLIGYLVTSIFLHMEYSRPMWLLVGVALAMPTLARAENAARERNLVAA